MEWQSLGSKDLEDRVQRNNLVSDTVRREHLSSRSETNGVFSPVLAALSLTPHLCSSKCVMGLPPAIHPPTDTARGSSQSDIGPLGVSSLMVKGSVPQDCPLQMPSQISACASDTMV